MTNLITAVLLILFAAFSRLMPHPENLAPVAAAAIFAGLFMNKKYAIIIPIAATFLSDIFIGLYPYVLWVYGTYAVIAVLGLLMQSKVRDSAGFKKAGYIYGTTIAASIIFFLVTNFGVWTSGLYYEMSINGLMQSYIAAIPFFRTSLLADAVYITLMTGVYMFVTRMSQVPAVQESTVRKK